jgi:sugar lactone lactonase YvrE
MRPRAIRTARALRLGLALVPPAIAVLCYVGCAERADRAVAVVRTNSESSTYVASLGNLRTGARPSTAEIKLATFFFGVEPEPPLGLIKPMHVAATDGELWVSDGALRTVLRWTPGAGALEAASLIDPPTGPSAVAICANGDRLVAGENGAIGRFSADGRTIGRYVVPESRSVQIGGVASVGDEVWVTNVHQHRIEAFDRASGAHRRSIGERGHGPAQFGFPLDVAVGSDGNAYVVDMLNARVQVLDRTGRWIRDIGGPGDRIGRFGRPKSVAVGPDGTVFVVDAASQCVHVFDERGRPLQTFGGGSDGGDALVLPAGIAIWNGPLDAAHDLPSGFRPAYYVLVAEQIVRPGLRVYAWSGRRAAPEPRTVRPGSSAARLVAQVENPHWRADGCTACHPADAGAPGPIDATTVDHLCLSCHDGKKAIDEAHPVGRVAHSARTNIPDGWPLVNGRIGCLTCHDIRKHCDAPGARPADNPGVVRGFDAANPLTLCTQCHISQEWRVNPHRSEIAGLGSPAATCGFCHVSMPRQIAAGGWEFDAKLRDRPTRLCLNCHTMHADPAPQGHLDALVSAEKLRAIVASESRVRGAAVSDNSQGMPAGLLPLVDSRVTCATCHNPHATDGALAALLSQPFGKARSNEAVDAGKSLRLPHMQLCLSCHEK